MTMTSTTSANMISADTKKCRPTSSKKTWLSRIFAKFNKSQIAKPTSTIDKQESTIIDELKLIQQLQTTFIVQRQQAIIEQLKYLLVALHEHLSFDSPDNIYVAMFLVKQQQEAIKITNKLINNPNLIVKRIDGLISQIDMLIGELPESWGEAISPYVNDLQMLMSLPDHECVSEPAATSCKY